MKNKSTGQNIISEIKKLGKSFRTELKKTEKTLRQEILRVDERVEGKVDRVETKLDKISIQLDGFIGRVDNLTVDNKVGANQTRELRVQVDGHEKRIKQLELTP